MKMNMEFKLIFVIVFLAKCISGTCDWPDFLANTVWDDSSKGEITFTTDTLTGWTFKTAGTEYNTWKCHSKALYQSDNIIVAITPNTFELFSKQFYGFLCMQLTEVTQSSYRYYLKSGPSPEMDGERVGVSEDSSSENWGLLCLQDDMYADSRPTEPEYRVMIKNSNAAAAKIDCPYIFLGSYDYTHTADGNNSCDSLGDVLSTCTDSQKISFDYNTCSTKVAYSVSDSVWCVDTVPSGGNNYVTVYNGNDADTDIDNVNVYRFSCFAISGDGSKASVVPNSCRNGQTPDNVPAQTGQSNGATLTLTKSTETCLTCPLLTPPDSGTVSYSTNGAVTSASFNCSSEYSLAGPETRVCQSDHTWSDENPTCTCILPSTPANGSFAASVDGTLTYSCDVGFVLNGDRTRTCQSNSNTWSGVEPTCDPCDVISLTTGLSIAASSTGITTISSFTCAAGYTLVGEVNATCLLAGTWDTYAPTCISCDNISNTDTRQVEFNTDGFTSTATFTCVTGYHVVGANSSICDDTGAWQSIPKCECDEQVASADGNREGNGTSSQFTCNVGYNLVGSSVTECLDDGTGWSADPPYCDGCDALGSLSGGYFNLSTDGKVTMATYSCNVGYTMSGQQLSYCRNDGSWNGTAPSCVKCPDLSNPDSGTVSINTDGATSTAQYECASGYDISRLSTSTCQTDGTWTNTPPTCSCSPASVPANGAILSDNGESVYYQCDVNYSMNGSSVRECATDGTGWSGSDPLCVPCEALNSVSGGSVTPETDGVNTKAQYSCDIGYSINGRKEITCNSDGTWDSSQSTCTECGTLVAPDGGSFTLYTDGDTVTKATFTCEVGYTLDGYSDLTCQSTGQWDNKSPQCVQCKDRGHPTSGNLTLSTDGQTTTGVYTCADGYTLLGTQTLSCRIDGNWNYPESECKCETPNAPVNGNVSADGDIVAFSCDTGFTMSGDNTGTCNNDGTGWSIVTPQCAQCEGLDNFTSGNVTYTSDGSTTIVEYSCPEGSSLQGNHVASCNSSGYWEAELPECVSCPTLQPVSVSTGSVTLVTNGTTTSAQYTCPQGYEVKGSPTLTCNSDGTWSNDPSDCVCETPTLPDGGNYTISDDGLSVSFACGEGYTMVGEPTISCSTDGSGWAFEYPNCTKCENLLSPSNGNITLETSGTQTRAIYTCEVGYTLDGGTTIQACQEDGTWTTVEQTCVSCPDLPSLVVVGASVMLSSNGSTTTATYTCPTGYEVSGSEQLTCNSSGVWSSAPATCVCKTPDDVEGRNFNKSENGLGIIFACGEGYTMNGVQDVTCATDGSGWTLSFPNCTKCDDIAAPSGGNVTLVTNGTQTIAIYRCGLGSSLDGQSTPGCQEDGTWKSSEPTCVSCPSLPDVSIDTGIVTFETDGITTKAVYYCPQGYQVSGQQELTCSTSGAWSSNPSDCVCITPDVTEGGNVNISEDALTAIFTCDAGYTMVGEQTLACGTDGSGWNVTRPNCTKCADLSSLSGGNVAVITSGTKSSAVYTCDIGFSLDGQPTLQCGEDGTWSQAQPFCESCPDVVNITSGISNLTTDGQTTRVVYTCANGYKMEGNSTLSCLPNGTWDSDPPICFCESPSSPLFGSVTANKTTAIYSCDEGYILKGVSIRTCRDNGQGWTESAPSCTTCDLLISPSDGYVNLTSNGTVTIATFSCDNGFSMNGTQSMICLDDGSWSEQTPNCVACPTLTQPASGTLVISSDNVQTSAIYTCTTGYYIVGEDNLVCSSEGQWSADEPYCACDNVTSPANGMVNISVENGIATFTCDIGFSIDGMPTRTCASDGSGWSGTQPSCVGCPSVNTTTDGTFEVVTDGTVTTVNFQCVKGATIDGPISLTCLSDGTWTSNQPTCVSCPDIETPSSGNVVIETDGQVSTVIYTCADNYEVQGDSTQQCRTDGTWSGSNTTCVCSSPASPANGNVTIEDDKLVAMYTCDLYFSLVGNKDRSCQSDGAGWTGTDPLCVQCETLSSPTNGSIFTNTNGTHTLSTFECSLGTSMQGEETSVCLNGATWSSQEPTCVTCPNVLDPNSGTVTISSDGTTTNAVYACAIGYFISGHNMSTCLSDGSWSNQAPECLCEEPSDIDNGTVTSSGKVAIFECNIGFTLSGNSVSTCYSDGSGWSGLAPLCIKCNDLNEPSGGAIGYTTNGTVTTASFQCEVGASMNGSTSLTCQKDGSWNDISPSCVKCEDLVTPENGVYKLSTDGTTTTVQLQCKDGYEAAGETVIECGTDGQWVYNQQSTCDKVGGQSSLLDVLIGVSVASLVIIATLAIFLTIFVYLYLRQRRNDRYSTDVTTTSVLAFDPQEKSAEDVFDLKPVKMSKSAAPVNHQHSAFDISGPFSTSPAPEGFTGNGALPESPLPMETHRSGTSIISFRRSATTLTNKNFPFVNAISISEAQQTKSTPALVTKNTNGHVKTEVSSTELKVPKLQLNKLSPIPNHKERIGRLDSASPQIKKVIKESKFESVGRQSPTEGRPPSVMSHALSVANCDSKSLDSVSMVAD